MHGNGHLDSITNTIEAYVIPIVRLEGTKFLTDNVCFDSGRPVECQWVLFSSETIHRRVRASPRASTLRILVTPETAETPIPQSYFIRIHRTLKSSLPPLRRTPKRYRYFKV